MAVEIARRDKNMVPVLLGVSASSLEPRQLRVDESTNRLLVDAGTITTSSASVGTTGAAVPASGDYIAGNKAGNLTGLLIGQQTMANSLAVTLASDQTALSVDTELPTAAALSDTTGNPTAPMVGASLMAWDGTQWVRPRVGQGDGAGIGSILHTSGMLFNATNFDRIRSIINANNSTGTGIQAVGLIGQFDDTSPNAITENQFGNIRMSTRREMYQQIRDAAGNERGANVTSNNSLQVSQKASTGTLSNVAASATSVTVLASNTARIGATITNDSSSVLYLKFGATASTTSYTVVLAGAASAPFSYYEVPAGYTGIIDGIWASATGNARVTEIT